jgi:hypothetical protein
MEGILQVTLWVIAALLWVIAIVSQILMVIHRKPDVALFQAQLMYNPFLMQIRGTYYLTAKGILWRNVSWVCALIFLLILLTVFWNWG